MRNMARFRLSSHNLRIETGRYDGTPYIERICELCDGNHVQDEQHIVFDCMGTDESRSRYEDIFEGIGHGDLRSLINSNNRDVLMFISECMDMLDSMQAEQPPQAEGQPL